MENKNDNWLKISFKIPTQNRDCEGMLCYNNVSCERTVLVLP